MTPKRHVAQDGTVTYKVRFRASNRQTSESFASEREAKRFVAALAAHGPERARELFFTPTTETADLAVDALAERFFVWKAGRVRSDRTVHDYRRDYDHWIKPTFGKRSADTITAQEVQDWVEAMTEGTLGRRPLSAKSVADKHAILHGIFSWAAAPTRQVLAHNPVVGTELPKRRATPPIGMRPQEWQALYPALQQINADAADLALFLLGTGWRWSEATAMSAYAVEDYGDSMFITMSQVVRRNAAGEHVIVADAKSDAGLRRIRVSPTVATMVRRRLDTVTGDALVFTNRAGRQWHYSNFLHRAWIPAVNAANLQRRPSPHWLRHTHVVWAVRTGEVSLPELQRRLGHASIATTYNTYGRMIDDVSDRAMTSFDAILDGDAGLPELEAS